MRRAFAFLLLINFLWMVPSHSAVNFSSRRPAVKAAPAPAPGPLRTFTVGERLAFEVFWIGVPVGLGELWVKEKVQVNGREAFHVVAVAETNEFLSKIYPVRDEVHTYIDVETFYSLQFEKKVSEGRYRADEKIVFDWKKKKGFYESLHNKSVKEFDIAGPVHDILSAFYWFRLQPVQEGQGVKVTVNSEEKEWEVEIQVLRRESKEVRGGGVIDTFLVEPKAALKGVFYKRGRTWVHFTADEKRIPILVTFHTPFGPVTGVLKNPSMPV